MWIEGTYRCENCHITGTYRQGVCDREIKNYQEEIVLERQSHSDKKSLIAAYPIYCFSCKEIQHTDGFNMPFSCIECKSEDIKLFGNDTNVVIMESIKKNHLQSRYISDVETCPFCGEKKLIFREKYIIND